MTDGEQRITVWNPAAEQIYGWSVGEVLGQLVNDVLKTELTEAQRGVALEQVGAAGTWRDRVVQRHRDGRALHILSSVSALRDEAGITALVAINRDISADVRRETERRLTETSLRRIGDLAEVQRGIDERLRAIVAIGCDQLGLPTGIIARIEADRYEVVCAVDPRGQLASGAVFDAGDTICEAASRGDRPLRLDRLTTPATASHPGYRDGSIREYIGAPIRDDKERVWGTISFSGAEPRPARFSHADEELVRLLALLVGHELARDVAVNRQRDNEARLQTLQKAESLALMVSGLAHDFNNLLAGISGAADVAIGRVRDGRTVDDLLDEIRSGARAGASMGRRLLGLVSPVGKDEPADPDRFIAESRDLFALLLPPEIELSLSLDTGGARVSLAAGAFEQILLNLVVNARDAMPDGGRLVVRTRALTSPAPRPLERGVLPAGELVVIEVEDSGCGIDDETRAAMFDLFFTTKPTGAGTGLGLATILTITTDAGGAIEVDSEIGRGSCFRVYLPAVSREPAAVAPAAGVVALVVDEDPDIRAIVRDCLEPAGYKVFEAADGEAALARGQVEPGLDLIIASPIQLDAGGELDRALAQTCPGACRLWMTPVPIVLLAETGRLPGNEPVVSRPPQGDELLAAVELALGGRRSQNIHSVLLVEDHYLARLTLTELLEATGREVTAVDRGTAALAVLDELSSPLDVLITDLTLPDTDGFSLASQIRARVGEDLRVVFVSGIAPTDPGILEALEGANTEFLQKPFDIGELEALLSGAP